MTWEDTDLQSHAVSFGSELAPPSPKCRTRPQRGFVSEPIAGNCDINIFSKIVDTVCDFPDPEQVLVRRKIACDIKLTLNSTNYCRKGSILVKGRQ